MITIGMSSEASLTVRSSDTAAALGIEPGDQFPPVFATSRLIALMELAAARLMRPQLQAAERRSVVNRRAAVNAKPVQHAQRGR